MEYLSRFESFNNRLSDDEINSICDKYYIEDYTINEDGSVDVDGDVNLNAEGLKELPLKFRNINGTFDCSDNQLTSLKGSPDTTQHFDCSYNYLTNLEYCPKVSSNSFDCSNNKLTSLRGSSGLRTHSFICSKNKLTTLEGGPQDVNIYVCSLNMLESLKGLPEELYELNCQSSDLKSLDGSPKKVFNFFISGNRTLRSLENGPEEITNYNIDRCSISSLVGIPDVRTLSCINNNILDLNGIKKVKNLQIGMNPVYEFYTLFNDVGEIDLFNEYDIIRENKTYVLDRLNSFLIDIDKPTVTSISGYKKIE